ncbi:helix-turn-helix transcriptional regulator [Tsukamurella pseudospumae]|uniref:helix-turn-helix transcriptional regulator n=1 Tax=Tsukamurella pseudospumae TaxID=239498 RepID=UPI0009EC3F5C|nr:helix-turn-helix transcriptional regulator [Tsukamurella pseudospumae]
MILGFGKAYGERVRALREAAGATQEQLSRELARFGVVWSRARVAQVEAGRGVPDLETMMAVARALTLLGGNAVRLADLLPEWTTGREVAALRIALHGEPVPMIPPRSPEIGTVPEPDPRDDRAYGVVEDLVVKQVGDHPEVVLRVARRLYGHSGTEERARRAGLDPSPQRLGAMGRPIVKELVEAVRAELEDGGGGHG